MSHTIMIGLPFLISWLCSFEYRKKFLVLTLTRNRYIYLHEALQECVSGQDNMSHLITVTFWVFKF